MEEEFDCIYCGRSVYIEEGLEAEMDNTYHHMCHIEYLESEISRSQWISVEDRLPKKERINYLVIDDQTGYVSTELFMVRMKFRWDKDEAEVAEFSDWVTHWMPIPKLPGEKI
jgi:hypothetical protein